VVNVPDIQDYSYIICPVCNSNFPIGTEFCEFSYTGTATGSGHKKFNGLYNSESENPYWTSAKGFRIGYSDSLINSMISGIEYEVKFGMKNILDTVGGPYDDLSTIYLNQGFLSGLSGDEIFALYVLLGSKKKFFPETDKNIVDCIKIMNSFNIPSAIHVKILSIFSFLNSFWNSIGHKKVKDGMLDYCMRWMLDEDKYQEFVNYPGHKDMIKGMYVEPMIKDIGKVKIDGLNYDFDLNMRRQRITQAVLKYGYDKVFSELYHHQYIGELDIKKRKRIFSDICWMMKENDRWDIFGFPMFIFRYADKMDRMFFVMMVAIIKGFNDKDKSLSFIKSRFELVNSFPPPMTITADIWFNKVDDSRDLSVAEFDGLTNLEPDTSGDYYQEMLKDYLGLSTGAKWKMSADNLKYFYEMIVLSDLTGGEVSGKYIRLMNFTNLIDKLEPFLNLPRVIPYVEQPRYGILFCDCGYITTENDGDFKKGCFTKFDDKGRPIVEDDGTFKITLKYKCSRCNKDKFRILNISKGSSDILSKRGFGSDFGCKYPGCRGVLLINGYSFGRYKIKLETVCDICGRKMEKKGFYDTEVIFTMCGRETVHRQFTEVLSDVGYSVFEFHNKVMGRQNGYMDFSSSDVVNSMVTDTVKKADISGSSGNVYELGMECPDSNYAYQNKKLMMSPNLVNVDATDFIDEEIYCIYEAQELGRDTNVKFDPTSVFPKSWKLRDGLVSHEMFDTPMIHIVEPTEEYISSKPGMQSVKIKRYECIGMKSGYDPSTSNYKGLWEDKAYKKGFHVDMGDVRGTITRGVKNGKIKVDFDDKIIEVSLNDVQLLGNMVNGSFSKPFAMGYKATGHNAESCPCHKDRVHDLVRNLYNDPAKNPARLIRGDLEEGGKRGLPFVYVGGERKKINKVGAKIGINRFDAIMELMGIELPIKDYPNIRKFEHVDKYLKYVHEMPDRPNTKLVENSTGTPLGKIPAIKFDPTDSDNYMLAMEIRQLYTFDLYENIEGAEDIPGCDLCRELDMDRMLEKVIPMMELEITTPVPYEVTTIEEWKISESPHRIIPTLSMPFIPTITPKKKTIYEKKRAKFEEFSGHVNFLIDHSASMNRSVGKRLCPYMKTMEQCTKCVDETRGDSYTWDNGCWKNESIMSVAKEMMFMITKDCERRGDSVSMFSYTSNFDEIITYPTRDYDMVYDLIFSGIRALQPYNMTDGENAINQVWRIMRDLGSEVADKFATVVLCDGDILHRSDGRSECAESIVNLLRRGAVAIIIVNSGYHGEPYMMFEKSEYECSKSIGKAGWDDMMNKLKEHGYREGDPDFGEFFWQVVGISKDEGKGLMINARAFTNRALEQQ